MNHSKNIVITRSLRKSSLLVALSIYMLLFERDLQQLKGLRRIAEHGRLGPIIDSGLPFYEVARAHEMVEGGGLIDKVVLDIAGE